MEKFESIDWFLDPEVHQDPYPYYDYLRAQGPAVYLPRHNVVAVTDYAEGLKIFRDDQSFSAVNAVTGPFPPLPFTPEGEDITAQIEANRPQMPMTALLMTMDRPQHASHRALLMGLITPKRLKQNEEFIRRLVNRQIDTFIGRGAFESTIDLGHPLAVLVVADLLGIPEIEHARFLQLLPATPGTVVGGKQASAYNPLAALAAALTDLLLERRDNPRGDVLTDLALAKFPDGTMPDLKDVVNVAAFLFAAGQDTTVRLIGSSLQIIGDNPELQRLLRSNHDLIPAFIEEVLRIESPSKVDFRLTRKQTRIGNLDVEPGTTVMIMIGAINRDPTKFPDPAAFVMQRSNLHDHLAFGRGNHACAGSPLARSEVRIALEGLFDRTANLGICEARHGPAGARRYEYPARYTMRGPKELHVTFTPA